MEKLISTISPRVFVEVLSVHGSKGNVLWLFRHNIVVVELFFCKNWPNFWDVIKWYLDFLISFPENSGPDDFSIILSIYW